MVPRLLHAQEINGCALLSAATFSTGPTSGQFINSTNGITAPFTNRQPVQGFSGIIHHTPDSFLVLTDNGFGARANSADSLLGFHEVKVDFKTASSGSGTVTVHGTTILSDPDRKIPFPIVADQTFYPNGATNIAVDAAIKAGRLLTGADFDLESFRRVADGSLWFGDEFGPFLLHTDASGKVVDAPIPLPGVKSPSHPQLNGEAPTLPASRGFEGMAMSEDGTRLFPMLEGPLFADTNQRRLLIYEFDTVTKAYTGRQFAYRMDGTRAEGHHIGDFSPVGGGKFVVTETDTRDASNGFKRLFLVDMNRVDSEGFLAKALLLDLLRIPDPQRIARSGAFYPMPFSTIEGLILTSTNELLILNDNNFPFSTGRQAGVPDGNEFIRVVFPQALRDMPVAGTFPTLTGQQPLVLGHRGVAGYRPDHTLEGYQLAIELGADFIEPDLVSTKDGVLIARHEPMLGGTTDVASRPEYLDRRTTKVLDGVSVTDWFASDFTLAEIKTLRAIQPVAARDQRYNGQFSIPTLEEVIALAKAQSQTVGRVIGIYPETKHPTFHDSLGLSLEEPLLAALTGAGWNHSNAPVFIQSFEVSNLRELNARSDVKLVQLIDADDVKPDGTMSLVAPYAQPYDFVVAGDPRTFADLLTPAGLDFIRTYADGIGPWKPYLFQTRIYDPNGDGGAEDRNGDGRVNIQDRESVGDTGIVAAAHRAGLFVHAFTFRNDASLYGFSDPVSEYLNYFKLGVDGVFTDFADTAFAARTQLRDTGVSVKVDLVGYEPGGSLRLRLTGQASGKYIIETRGAVGTDAVWLTVLEVTVQAPVTEVTLPADSIATGAAYFRVQQL